MKVRAMNAPALELVGAGRWFGSRAALHPVSLRLETGTVCVVCGANGSGKSTLLRLAAGLLAPSCGTRRARDRAIYLRPGSGARSRQRVREAVATAALLVGGEGRVTADAIARAGMDHLADQRVGTLSAGQRGRLLGALALASRPDLACLDEPVAHLDEAGSAVVWNVVGELAQEGCAVLLAAPDRLRVGVEPHGWLQVTEGQVEVAR